MIDKIGLITTTNRWRDRRVFFCVLLWGETYPITSIWYRAFHLQAHPTLFQSFWNSNLVNGSFSLTIKYILFKFNVNDQRRSIEKSIWDTNLLDPAVVSIQNWISLANMDHVRKFPTVPYNLIKHEDKHLCDIEEFSFGIDWSNHAYPCIEYASHV